MGFKKNREKILGGNLFKVILTLSLPIMFNNLIQTAYNLIDTYFVSQIGGTQMAAITFVWPLIFFIISLGIGIGIAGTTLISQNIGKKNYDEVEHLAGQIFSSSLIFSVIIGTLGYFFAPNIIRFMKGTGLLYSEGLIYLRIILFSTPAMFFSFAFNAIKQAEGDNVSPMVLSVVSVVINIILDPLFIFTLNMGISGAAWATVIARYTLVLTGIYLLKNKNNGIKIKLKYFKLNFIKVKELVKLGLPASIGQSTSSFGFIILNMFIIDFGQNTMAAYGIGNRINSMLFLPALGIGSAMNTIVGQNLGAKQISRVKEAIKKAMVIVSIMSILGTFFIYVYKENIISTFTSDSDIFAQSVEYLSLISMTIICLGIFQIIVGLFQGAGRTKIAMFITMSRLWLFRIPLILILKNFESLGSKAVWYAMVSSNYLIVILAFMLYFKVDWTSKFILDRKLVVEELS